MLLGGAFFISKPFFSNQSCRKNFDLEGGHVKKKINFTISIDKMANVWYIDSRKGNVRGEK